MHKQTPVFGSRQEPGRKTLAPRRKERDSSPPGDTAGGIKRTHMEVIKTAIDGPVIIEPRIFKDDRGYFFESFSEREFKEKVADVHFVQTCTSSRTTRASRATE